jgi:hypothetical protein
VVGNTVFDPVGFVSGSLGKTCGRPRSASYKYGLKSLSDLPDPARIILEFAQIRPLNRH